MYYASNSFFEMIRKNGGEWNDKKHRPIVCLVKSAEHPEVFWAIPMGKLNHRESAQQDRLTFYLSLPSKDIRSCYYHIGRTTAKSIFFISDAIPITSKYIESCHLGPDQKPYVIKNPKLISELNRKLLRILSMENSKPNSFRQHITDVKRYLIDELSAKENCNMSEKPIRGSQPQPDHIFISIADDAKTTMNVTWRTSTDVKNGYVLYREDGTDEIKRTEADTEVFKSDIDISNMFWAKLTGLKPDTKYFYTCGDDSHRSDEFSFTTEPENLTKFKFICVSDQQKGGCKCPDYSHFTEILKTVLAENPDTRFILTGGDNTDCGQHEVQWNGAFEGVKGIVESIPFMMSVGNHDNRGFKDYEHGIGRYYAEPAEFFNNQFKGSYAYDGPENWKTENYTFNYGNVHFQVIGVNGPEEVNQWMIDDLNKNRRTWNIGTYHFPICYSGSDCANYDAYPVMTEGFEMLDLVFSGHEHNFARSFPRRNEELFERPSQGTIHYMLGNSNQNPPGTRAISKVWHSAFYCEEEPVSVVAIVEVDGEKITLTSKIIEDGRIVDKCTIDKAKDEITPYAIAPKFNQTRMTFKGALMGLCQSSVPCENVDGTWYACFGTLIGYIGGYVLKEKGKITLEAYGKRVEFFENSDQATVNGETVTIGAKVLRLRNQLYMPADACELFDMRWAYAARNNFISFEHEDESLLITEQP